MKEITDVFDIYDIDGLNHAMRKKHRTTVVLAIIFALLALASAAAIIFLGRILWVFIVSAAALVAFTALDVRLLSASRFGLLKTFSGRIVRIHKDVKAIRNHPMATFALFRRRYDSYWRDEIRLTLNIESDGEIYTVRLDGITDKQSDLYKEHDTVVNVYAAPFPLKAIGEDKKWICPVCGKINHLSDKKCSLCRVDVLK